MDDAQIVDLFFSRDQSAVAAAQEKFGARLRALAQRICGDRETAKECENDAYLAAWNSIPPKDPRDHLFAYLAALTRRRAINRLKEATAAKRGGAFASLTEELSECVPGGESVEETLEAEALSRAIGVWLRALPAEKRALFLRRYWFSEPTEEIAKRFGWSAARVKSALFRLRKELKKHLEKEGFSC